MSVLSPRGLLSPRSSHRRKSSVSQQDMEVYRQKLNDIVSQLDKAKEEFKVVDTFLQLQAGKQTVLSAAEYKEEKLALLKEALAKFRVQQFQEDLVLLKFLAVTNYDVNKAASNYLDDMKWRDENTSDFVADGPAPFGDLVRKLVPHALVGIDKQGCPVFIEKTGLARVGELLEHVTMDEFLVAHAHTMERALAMMKQSSEKLGTTVDTMTCVFDLEGLSFAHTNGITFLQQAIVFDHKHYPERIGKVFIINAPWIAPTLWRMLEPHLNLSMRSKITMINGDYKPELLKFIDEDQLPEEYGGKSEVKVEVASDADILLHVNRDEAGLEMEEEYIMAGSSFNMTLRARAGDEVKWSVQIKDKQDVQFYIEMQQGDEEDVSYVKAPLRVKAVKGRYVAVADCSLRFVWDNSEPPIAGKTMLYHASVTKKAE